MKVFDVIHIIASIVGLFGLIVLFPYETGLIAGYLSSFF